MKDRNLWWAVGIISALGLTAWLGSRLIKPSDESDQEEEASTTSETKAKTSAPPRPEPAPSASKNPSKTKQKKRRQTKTQRRNAAKLARLRPDARNKVKAFLSKARQEGIILLITSGYRDRDCKEQNELYAKGRTKPGKKVTNAKCGQSWHNVAVAVDIVEVKAGKALWKNPKWDHIGALGKSVGLKWGGDWKSFRDRPHFYAPGGQTLAQAWSEHRNNGLA